MPTAFAHSSRSVRYDGSRVDIPPVRVLEPKIHESPAGRGARRVSRRRPRRGSVSRWRGERFRADTAGTRPMRQRDDPTDRGRYPAERRRRPDTRDRTDPHRGAKRNRNGSARRWSVSPVLVPAATLAAIVAAATLAAVRSAGRLLGEWSLAIAVVLGVAGCLLGAVLVAHVTARVAAGRGVPNR